MGTQKIIFYSKARLNFEVRKITPAPEKKGLLFACYTEGNALAKKYPSTWAAALKEVHTCQTEVLFFAKAIQFRNHASIAGK